jgi:acyl-CoA reductase-like NAD-dependent aldehyde dehydrogenase
MMPAALTGVPDTAAIMREEIFGPLLPLVGCDTIEAAIAYVRARPRPLALSLFSRDEACVKKVMAETVSGGVTINDTLLHIAQDGLPFGGVGPSGMGVYHGEDGFREFSHMKPVFTQSRVNGLGLFAPPYGRRFAMLVKMLLR